MGLLQGDKAIFYHPLDDADEYIKSKTWTGTADTSGAGKVGDAMSRVDIAASLAGTSADYDTVVGATRVAFCGWFREPSEAPAQTAAPATDSPIDNGATSASGTGVNGATVEVFVDDISVGYADAAVSGGVWSKTGMAALSTGEVVSARQRSAGELQSDESNEVTVTSVFEFGAETEYLSTAASSYNAVAALSTTKFVVAYRYDSDYGAARIGTVAGTDITFGADAKFPVWWPVLGQLHLAALDASKFVVCYADVADSGRGTAKVGTVSGTDITFGAETEFLSGNFPVYTCAAALSSTVFVVAYRDAADSGHGTAKVGTVSGTDITFGAETEFLSTGVANNNALTAISASKVVVVYRDNPDSGHGTAKVGTVTGTSIAFGAETEFTSSASSMSVTALGETVFVVTYKDDADSSHGTAKVGTVSGTDITFGAETEFLAGTCGYVAAVTLSATKFAVAYRDNSGDPQIGLAKVGTVAGADITFSASAEFLGDTGPADPVASALSADKFAVAYTDDSDSAHGTAKVATV